MKDYQKPEFELITLVAQEEVTSGDGVQVPDLGTGSSIF